MMKPNWKKERDWPYEDEALPACVTVPNWLFHVVAWGLVVIILVLLFLTLSAAPAEVSSVSSLTAKDLV